MFVHHAPCQGIGINWHCGAGGRLARRCLYSDASALKLGRRIGCSFLRVSSYVAQIPGDYILYAGA